MSKITTEIKAWLTPILLLCIGWLLSNKLDTIDANFNKLEPLVSQMAEVKYQLKVHEDRLSKYEDKFDKHQLATESNQRVLAKPEDELSYDKLTKRGIK